jgi:hypothetical protein
LRSFVDECAATCLRIFAYIGAVTVLAILAAKIFGTPVLEAAVDPAARNPWVDVERPMPAFSLTIPEFAEPEPDYAIYRHAEGGGRRDVMSWGTAWSAANPGGSRLMIEIYRPGRELKAFGEPAGEVAARIAELGGSDPLRPTEAIGSKFGRFTTYDFSAKAVGGSRHSCIGFVHAFRTPLLEITGWYCKGGEEVVDRGTLACALERLSLLMSASEPKVTALFAHAELKRRPCMTRPTTAFRSSSTRRLDWINGPKGPKLRGRVVAR